MTPQARLTGQDQQILAERQRKLALAREHRRQAQQAEPASSTINSSVQLVIPEPENSISC